MSSKVSVIVPVYNSEKYISTCLDSIINQTYSNIEVIIVDDGSTDRSKMIIDKFREDNRIVYYYQLNSGPSEARNNGILHSTGEYVIFIDADDTVEKHYIERLVNKMISSGADLVCCGYNEISKHGVKNYTDFHFQYIDSVKFFMDMVCKGTGGVLWSKIYKREIIVKNNLQMDKNIFMSEDLIFVLQYATYCDSFAAIEEYLYNYNRLNENSISSNISKDYIQNYITVWKQVEEIFHSVNFDEYKINEIIIKRIQDVVISLIEQQSIQIKDIGMKNATRNVRGILSVQYIEKNRKAFSTKSAIYKPFIFFIKNKLIKASIVYGICLNILRDFKNKFNSRKQESLLKISY